LVSAAGIRARRWLRGEFVDPIYFRGRDHEQSQRDDCPDGDRQAGQAFEKEAVAEEDDVGELRGRAQLSEALSDRGEEISLASE